MPADRSKSSKRSGEDVQQLTWTIPVESTSAISGGTAFTCSFPSSTPWTTIDDGPPPLVDQDAILFPPNGNEETIPARKQTHGKKKPEDHIPRPPNAFILFRSSFIKGQHVPTEVETNHSTLSKIIGLTWKNLPDEERQFWHAKAKVALDEHKRKFPQYAFRPTHGRGKGTGEKRKVREVGPKDPVRCAKIAELLVQGKKGHELDAAIQEFDKHHVPQIITRFDQPITAHMYRRSSSAPVPGTEEDSSPSKKRYASAQSSSPATPALLFTSELCTLSEQSPISYDQFSSPVLPSDSFIPNYYPVAAPDVTEQINPFSNSNNLFNYATDRCAGQPPSALTIDIPLFATGKWDSSSPSSADTSMPATPSCMGSPSPDAFTQYSYDALEASLAKSFNNSFALYPSNYESQYANSFEPGSPAVYPSFEEDQCSKIHMVNQDLAFSVLMASLPEYSL